MSSYLAAFISTTGVPLFIRSTPGLPQLSFPVIASLNGVHTFTDSAKATLHSSSSNDVRIVWKNFHDNLTLILITTKDSKSDVHSEYLLTLIFNAMVLFLGLQNLFNFDNVESLKRNLRSCYSLIDELLCNQTMMCSLTQSVELIIDEDIKDLENGLISFGEAIQSDYANISVKNQIVNATESWWNLDPVELILLSILPLSLPLTQCADIPVYLPIASNQVPHRLLVLRLCDGVYLNCLCDTEPSLSITQSLALETFSPLRNKIMSLLPSIPRCLPSTIDLNHNVIAFCLVNIIKHQSVVSLPTPKTAERNFILSKGYQGNMSDYKKRSCLIQFYKSVINEFLPLELDVPGREKQMKTAELTTKERIPHTVNETYSCTKYFKGYAIHKTHYNFIAVFDVNTPTYSLHPISHDIMERLITRNIC